MSTRRSFIPIAFALFFCPAIFLYGWQIISFARVYFTLNEIEVNQIYAQIQIYQPLVAGSIAGLSLAGIIIFLIRENIEKSFTPALFKRVKFFFQMHFIFIFYLIIVFLLYQLNWFFHIMEMILFIFSAALLVYLGNILYHSEIQAWQHPTTNGSIIISGLLAGCALHILISQSEIAGSSILYAVIIFIFLTLAIMYTRVVYLSRHSKQTRNLVEILFGKYMLYFAIHLIAGLFIPLLTIAHSLYNKSENAEEAAVLILMGIVADRFLFIVMREEAEYKIPV